MTSWLIRSRADQHDLHSGFPSGDRDEVQFTLLVWKKALLGTVKTEPVQESAIPKSGIGANS